MIFYHPTSLPALLKNSYKCYTTTNYILQILFIFSRIILKILYFNSCFCSVFNRNNSALVDITGSSFIQQASQTQPVLDLRSFELNTAIDNLNNRLPSKFTLKTVNLQHE